MHAFDLKKIRIATLQELYISDHRHDACMDLELIIQKTIVKKSYPYTVMMQFVDPTGDVVDTFKKVNFITQNILNVLNELTPQIGRQLKTLFQSKGLVRMMISAPKLPDSDDIQAFKKESINIEYDADRRQAMTIIQKKRCLPVGHRIRRPPRS